MAHQKTYSKFLFSFYKNSSTWKHSSKKLCLFERSVGNYSSLSKLDLNCVQFDSNHDIIANSKRLPNVKTLSQLGYNMSNENKKPYADFAVTDPCFRLFSKECVEKIREELQKEEIKKIVIIPQKLHH